MYQISGKQKSQFSNYSLKKKKKKETLLPSSKTIFNPQ